MALVNKPDESIFASSAKQGEVDNFPDLLRGWGITFEQTQGIPPMEWFNFLFKRLDEKHAYLMQRGLPEWSATQDYTKGSCVQFDGVSYRALKDSKNNSPNESESQYWVRWGFTLSEIARATLTQYGLTQLYTGYNSQREDLALTPKTAFLLKQLIDSNTRALGNVIPNSKKSSAVNSNSNDTVATSAAVKTAYDKGVEAQNSADNAQRSANAAQNSADNAQRSANAAQNSADNAQRSANAAQNSADNAQRSANDGINRANNAQQTAEAANRNANTRVAKSGDTITGDLSFKQGDYSGLNLYNNNGYYLRLEGNNHANGTMLTAVYRKPNGENVAVAFLPKRDGTIAYIDQVVNKTGDSMTGTLTFTGATENYYIANYSWRMPIKFSGDTFIGNEVTGIGFNNNGSLNLGGRKNSSEFIATIDSEGIYTGGVVRATGHTAKAYGHGAFANQWTDKKAPYVVHNPNANGQNIYYPFIKGFNTNGSDYGTAFSLGYMTPGTINQFGSGAIHLLTDSGNGKIWWFGHDGVLRGDDFATNGGRKLSKSIQVNDIVVISGIINNGATIPLPAGFAEHECKFLVSMRSDNPDSTVWDINEDGSHLHYRYECKLEGRKVIARTWIGGHGSTSNRWIGGEANYIVIGIKGA